MTTATHQVSISDTLYQQLKQQAAKENTSVEALVNRTLVRNLAPPVEEDLPPELKTELEAMANLSDSALWQIAMSEMNADKVALYDFMLDRLKTNQITAEGRAVLTELRREAEALTLRKAHAFALLQSRGHKLPSLEELTAEKHSASSS